MKFDFDVSDMQPGDIIEQTECEKLVGMRRDDNEYRYNLRLLELRRYIEVSLRRIDRIFTITQKGGSLCILTHEQASEYNANTFRLGQRRMRRSFRRLVAVDTEHLSQEARNQHALTLACQSRILEAVKKRDVKPPSEYVDRRTPLITRKV